MSRITDKRRELRREAAERQRTCLKKLKANLRKARTQKAARLRKVQSQCKREQARIRREGLKAREQLRERIKRAKVKAREACAACKVSAKEAELKRIDKALGALEAERKAIAELREKAARLKDSRGRAGGLRSQELRRESDDSVRANLEDPWHLEVWEKVKHKIKAGPRLSRTEAFLKYLADHPEMIWEAQSAAEARWLREAEEEQHRMEQDWLSARQLAKVADNDLQDFNARLARSEQLADAVPF